MKVYLDPAEMHFACADCDAVVTLSSAELREVPVCATRGCPNEGRHLAFLGVRG